MVRVDEAATPHEHGLEHVEYADILTRGQSERQALVHRTRRGAAANKTVKVVCKRCNETWMSGMEAAVTPILTPLIRGQATLLNERDRQMMTDWIMLKVLVSEHTSYPSSPAQPVSTQQHREHFMVLREIPHGVRIWLARHNGTKWKSAIFGETTRLGLPHVPLPPPPRTKNAEVVTFGLGELLIHVLWLTWEPLYSWFTLQNIVPPFRALWPLDENDIRWPPLYTLTDADADRLVAAFGEAIRSKGVLWVED